MCGVPTPPPPPMIPRLEVAAEVAAALLTPAGSLISRSLCSRSLWLGTFWSCRAHLAHLRGVLRRARCAESASNRCQGSGNGDGERDGKEARRERGEGDEVGQINPPKRDLQMLLRHSGMLKESCDTHTKQRQSLGVVRKGENAVEEEAEWGGRGRGVVKRERGEANCRRNSSMSNGKKNSEEGRREY